MAQFASRPWGGFNIANVRKQYRYAFHNNRIPQDRNGESTEESQGDDDNGDDEDEDAEEEVGDEEDVE